jgi:hypothetical protein
MLIDTPFKLPTLSPWQKKQLLRHAKKVLTTQQKMTSDEGSNILHYTLQNNQQHESMRHYPKGDRIDHQTGSQYFYHCHREDLDSGEHGHFHCFLRYKQIPKHIKPTPLPDWDKYIDNPMTHVIAIAMNRFGQPIRLFTVNRWVTSEIWYDAKHTPKFTKRFHMTLTDDAYWQILDQWIESMIHLFAPQIAWVYTQRDMIVKEHQQTNSEESVYNNKQIEELSSIEIDLTQQIQWIINTP